MMFSRVSFHPIEEFVGFQKELELCSLKEEKAEHENSNNVEEIYVSWH